MSIRNQPHIETVSIDAISKKGYGKGTFTRADGVSSLVEVPGAIPGDTVEVQLLCKRKKIYKGILREVKTASPIRIVPKCSHFGECGGCSWQQMPYEEQLKIKQELINDCFEEVLTSDVLVQDVIPCKKQWHYRNKMEYSFSSDKAGHHYLGLYKCASRGKVVDLKECHLPSPWFVEALNAARDWWKESSLDAYHASKDRGSLRTLTLREGVSSGDRMINLTVSGNPQYAISKQQIDRFVAFMRAAIEPDHPDQKLSIFLTIQQIKKGQPTQFFEMHLYGSAHIREILHIAVDSTGEKDSFTFFVSPAAFFQPNTKQAEVLYSEVIKRAGVTKDSVIYDLYCGTGTLGICLAKKAKRVVGVELSREAILDARQNAKQNGISNISFFQGSVAECLESVKQSEETAPDVVVVDPPRAGLGEAAINEVVSLGAATLVYVSCNPKTQAEDMKQLLSLGYQLQELQPVDQFPHTYHLENIAILKRKGCL